MDVFQTDWKEKHESRGTQEPPTLLNVWQGYLGEEDETTVLERINVPIIFHPDQDLYHVVKIPERVPGELRTACESRKESGASTSTAGSLKRGAPTKDPGKEPVATSGAGGASGSMLGSVFGNVFQKKDDEPIDDVHVEPEAKVAASQSPDPVFSPEPIQPTPSPKPTESAEETVVERDCRENGTSNDHGEDLAEQVILELHFTHPPTIKETSESEYPPPENGLDHEENTPSENHVTENEMKAQSSNPETENLATLKLKGINKEYTSDEASSSVVSTAPSTPSRSKSRGMFTKLTGFMKRPKRRQLRKGSLEATSGDSSTSNSLYYDNNHRPPHSSMSVDSVSNKLHSKSLPMRSNSMPDRPNSTPAKNNHDRKSKGIAAKSSEAQQARLPKRRPKELPTEDFVLSDPEPEPPITIPRFAPYRPARPTDESVSNPLPCTALTTKSTESSSKHSAKQKQHISSKHWKNSSSRRSSTNPRPKNKNKSAHKQYHGTKLNHYSKSKPRPSCRRDDILKTPTNTNLDFDRSMQTPTGRTLDNVTTGRMLDNRGRCYRFPVPTTCTGANIFGLTSFDEDSDYMVSGECGDYSATTSGRRESSSSGGSVTSLPSLANFNNTFNNTSFQPVLDAGGSKSADIFRNYVKPMGREKSRSMSDIRHPNSLSSVVANFAVVRSPTKLTPPPRRRNHGVGNMFCLPGCFAPPNFDRALLLE